MIKFKDNISINRNLQRNKKFKMNKKKIVIFIVYNPPFSGMIQNIWKYILKGLSGGSDLLKSNYKNFFSFFNLWLRSFLRIFSYW